MEGRLALVRAAHLNEYISVLRKIGAPVDRELARSKLPRQVEEMPDLYVSVPVAIEWVARTGHDLQPMELGLLGSRNASLSSLCPVQHAAIINAQTCLKRLKVLVALSRLEDSAQEMTIQHEAGDVRVTCDTAGLNSHPFVCLSEWLNLQAVISVVRSVAGPSWQPSEICFVSSNRPSEAVLAAFPDTRVLVGQPHTSLVVTCADLARPTPEAITSADDPPDSTASGDERDDLSAPWEFIALLRMMVQPYLNDGRPGIAFAAEIAGMSTRTLQRRLTLCGSSYSQILKEARFALACAGLDDPAMKVIDVAMMAGYETPQHFTRAFRRFTGFTPSEYRRSCGENDFPATKALGSLETSPGVL